MDLVYLNPPHYLSLLSVSIYRSYVRILLLIKIVLSIDKGNTCATLLLFCWANEHQFLYLLYLLLFDTLVLVFCCCWLITDVICAKWIAGKCLNWLKSCNAGWHNHTSCSVAIVVGHTFSNCVFLCPLLLLLPSHIHTNNKILIVNNI